MTKDKVTFTAKGYVLGNCWGGGIAGYTSRTITGTSLKDIKEQAIDGLDGSLDSGMGFESLIGAKLHIRVDTTKVIGGKNYVNTEYKRPLFVGKMTRKERMFLLNIE